jgi:hypothetical protein
VQDVPFFDLRATPPTLFADAARHPFATARLKEALAALGAVAAPLGAFAEQGRGPAIVVGEAAELDDRSRQTLDLEGVADLKPGGYLLRTSTGGGRPTVSLIGGDAAGVVYAVQEFLETGLREDATAVRQLDVRRQAALTYRLFWTWDHSTNWYLEQLGLQEVGASNAYTKRPEGFVEDYRRLIDFMSRNRLNGLVIYGFLRDKHGGVESAKEVARYGAERGVRILPGVGINSYGGIYWEGNHRYNLQTWLRDNPHLRADSDVNRRFPMNPYVDLACPSKPENLAYHVEAIRWLCEEFQIGGINFETGDYGVCDCADCRRRRTDAGRWSLADVADLYPPLFEAARGARSDLWMVAEAYFDNLLDREALAPMAALPPDTIAQYCINRHYWPRVRSELTAERVAQLPLRKNVVRTHMGSQWNPRPPAPVDAYERYAPVARDFADLARLATTTGMDGMDVFGEVSEFSTVNEINLLAYATFSYDREVTWERFVADVLGPRLGGSTQAAEYLRLLDTPHEAGPLSVAVGRAREIAAPLTDDEQHRRWAWLVNRLYQAKAML